AVDGNVLYAQQFADVVEPLQQSSLERQRIEPIEDPAERVARRNAVGQLQEPLEPFLAAAGEGSDLFPGVGVGNYGTDGHRGDVGEQVSLAAIDPWVFEAVQVLVNGQG